MSDPREWAERESVDDPWRAHCECGYVGPLRPHVLDTGPDMTRHVPDCPLRKEHDDRRP